MLQRLIAISRKEFIQIRRDRRTLGMMIFLPILWLVVFGYAFSFDVQTVRVAVVDESATPIGQAVAEAFRGYDRFEQVPLAEESEVGVREAIFRDQLQMGIIIPAGFGLKPDVQLQVLIDGSDLFAAQTGARLLQFAAEPLQAQVKTAPDLEILYNPELKSANVMIPGLLGLVLMFITTMMTALGVVREREYGTLEQLVVTPIRPFELMLGKLLPYFLVGIADFALVFVAGIYLFDLEFAGSVPLFLGLSLLLVFTTLGFGLLLSTVAQNQQQAMQLVLMTVMPQFVVSGLIFPLESLPKVIQYVGHLFPFTYYVPIARGIFIKGQGLDLLWQPALVLAGYAVLMVTLSTLRFRKRIG